MAGVPLPGNQRKAIYINGALAPYKPCLQIGTGNSRYTKDR